MFGTRRPRIVHVVDRPVREERGSYIHWPRRFDHMQQAPPVEPLAVRGLARAFGLVTVSFHLGETASTIDLKRPRPSPLILEGALASGRSGGTEDRSITVRYGTCRRIQPPGHFEGMITKACFRPSKLLVSTCRPCGRTHLRHTGQRA